MSDLRIGTLPFQSVLRPMAVGAATDLDAILQNLNLKQEVKDRARHQIHDIKNALADVEKDNNKIQHLLDKLKYGKRLTAAEMAYIRKHAPDKYEYVSRIMSKRDLFEQNMRIAPTKSDVQITAFIIAKQIEKHTILEEREVLARHLIDAKREYEQTDEYKAKPDGPLDVKKKTAANKLRKKQKDRSRTQFVIEAYSNNKNRSGVAHNRELSPSREKQASSNASLKHTTPNLSAPKQDP